MEDYFRLKGELGYIARSIDAAVPYRIETNDAARAIELHVRQKTGEPHLQQIANLLTSACKLAEVHYGVSVDSLRHQVKSGNRTNAERLLSSWDTLTKFPAPSYNLEK